MELLNYLFCDMFRGILECYELTHVLPFTRPHQRQSCMSGQALLHHWLLRHFYRDHHHHHHHHHHHYCSLYLRNDQQIWITTKIHIFTKGFKHIECGHFLRDHAGFHEHNEPTVVLDKLWHDIINSHTVTKHACTFSCLQLATQYTKYTITLQ